MKKLNLYIVVLLAVGVTFIACNDKEEKEQKIISCNKSFAVTASNSEIDNISEEVATFHDYLINYFWNDIFEKDMRCNSDLILKMRDLIVEKAKTYPFAYISKDEFEKEIDNDTFVELCFDAMKYDTLNLSYMAKLYGDKLDMDFASVEKEANQIAIHLENLFYTSATPEEMEKAYESYVVRRLGFMKTEEEYLVLRFYADMYLSSFTTWCNILYGDENIEVKKKTSWLASAWNKAKQTAKAVWKEVKPVVKADAGGAAGGAIVGAAGGVAGAATGAATGAAASSIGKCIENM